jgi:hypothetical protein
MIKKKGVLANEKLQQMVADKNAAEHRKMEAERMEVKVLSKLNAAVIAVLWFLFFLSVVADSLLLLLWER